MNTALTLFFVDPIPQYVTVPHSVGATYAIVVAIILKVASDYVVFAGHHHMCTSAAWR